MSVSPSACWRPPCRLLCGSVEWRGGCDVLSSDWVRRLALCYSLSYCLAPPFSFCVCCHSIVGLVLCFCGRVVSLWNSGVDLCGAEGRVVSTVNCRFFMCCGVCFSVVCVLSCGLRNGGVWGGVLSCCLSSSSLCLPLLLFAVGVRGSARAAVRARTLSPNTIASSSCCVFSSLLCSPLFFAIRLSFCWNGGGGYHVSVCCVGMTAMGSLSRSFSFFW